MSEAMADGREEVVAFGQWLAAERGKRSLRGKPLSTPQLARMLNAYIQHQRLPVKAIHQQELSALENATVDRGPKKVQPWFAVIRHFFESNALDELLAASDGPPTDAGAGIVVDLDAVRRDKGDTVVRSPDGKVIGKIVWGD